MNTINIPRSADRQLLRDLLLEGGQSAPIVTADRLYFEMLRARIRRHSTE